MAFLEDFAWGQKVEGERLYWRLERSLEKKTLDRDEYEYMEEKKVTWRKARWRVEKPRGVKLPRIHHFGQPQSL